MNKLLFIMFLVLTTIASNAFAKSGSERFLRHFNHTDHVAIHGYDVLSYFEGHPTLGSEEYSVNYKGISFFFSTESNANKFKREPLKYLPQYGGWCATAVAMMNMKLDITPDSFVIEDGKLYLFSISMGPARDQWLESFPDIKDEADKNWGVMYAE